MRLATRIALVLVGAVLLLTLFGCGAGGGSNAAGVTGGSDGVSSSENQLIGHWRFDDYYEYNIIFNANATYSYEIYEYGYLVHSDEGEYTYTDTDFTFYPSDGDDPYGSTYERLSHDELLIGEVVYYLVD